MYRQAVWSTVHPLSTSQGYGKSCLPIMAQALGGLNSLFNNCWIL